MDLETSDLQKEVDHVAAQFESSLVEVRQAPKPEKVESLRLMFLGRKGLVSNLLEGLKQASKETRPFLGKSINQLKQTIEATIGELQGAAGQWLINERLSQASLDVTLPVEARPGSLHPVTLMRRELLREFRRMGFGVWDGPELDFEFYNFNALNILEHHPARDMQDTFYVKPWADAPQASPGDQKMGTSGDYGDKGGSDLSVRSQTLDAEGGREGRPLGRLLLRTHTSNLQIHAMLVDRPPLRVVAPGRVFRVDSDPTHTPMFHQIEAFVVDRGIHFGHLKGVIASFMRGLFGSQMKTRLRPSYFPFVEPGAEIDIQCVHCGGKGCRVCKETGWVEVGGAGMIHPNVFESVELDSEIYTGFAFGFGIDRMAMMKYKIPDLRQLFEGSISYLSQYPVVMSSSAAHTQSSSR